MLCPFGTNPERFARLKSLQATFKSMIITTSKFAFILDYLHEEKYTISFIRFIEQVFTTYDHEIENYTKQMVV